ncbi:MAG TPA: tripartite tricarboxylate transporter substrate binding protein [Casimicrobiaceae bacterium]|nr:tripartite tricarboxylate transporter substrate binding protein [Casimicrobiaceae bacterium]
MTVFFRAFIALVAGALSWAALESIAQDPYPAKAIRLIVPFPPGAGTDNVARLIAQKMAEGLRQSVVIENRTGAGGAIGAAEAAKADPDGYTLLFVAGPFTTVAASQKNPGYDPQRQFAPVAPIAAGPLAFVVNASVPAGTMREFIALSHREPGKFNYGSAGTGSINHLALELMKARTGVNVVHVPYRGIADATKDLLGGQIQAMTASIPATLPLLSDRRVKVLAVTGAKRAPQLPGVPSWQEEGVVADADVTNYWGIVAPAGTPPEILAKLNREIQTILGDPEVRERLEREGAEVVDAGSPDRLGQIIAHDLARWKKLVADIGMTLE